MADFYDKNALSYFDQTASVNPQGFLGPFADRLVPGSRVLDVGCGSGRDLLWLRKRGYEVRGLERSSTLAKLARKHASCKVLEADFELWDFAANPMDGILLVGSLVHIPNEDLGRILGRIIRGLVPHGLLLLTLKEGKGFTSVADGRIFYLWQDKDLRGLLKELSLEVLYFDRLVSSIRQEDTWLTYVLEKIQDGARKCVHAEPGRSLTP
jgi:SAM-dependent methyltransferase